ncbi:MAG: hypothetical protein PVI03_02055 [Candidatus Thorarchaeota archaeon]
MSFDKEKAERFVVLPAGRLTCLMCDKRSRQGEVLKLTKRFKVRLCPKCYKEYEQVVTGRWREIFKQRGI